MRNGGQNFGIFRRTRIAFILCISFTAFALYLPFVALLTGSRADGFEGIAGVLQTLRNSAAEIAFSLKRCFVVSVVVTSICAILAWAECFLSPRIRRLSLLVFTLPLFLSDSLKSYAIARLLENGGAISRALRMCFGDTVSRSVYLTETSVCIGMVVNCLPSCALATALFISPKLRSLLRAGSDIGLGWRQNFTRVFFPTAIVSLFGAGILVFAQVLGRSTEVEFLAGTKKASFPSLINSLYDAGKLAEATMVSGLLVVFVASSIVIALVTTRRQ